MKKFKKDKKDQENNVLTNAAVAPTPTSPPQIDIEQAAEMKGMALYKVDPSTQMLQIESSGDVTEYKVIWAKIAISHIDEIELKSLQILYEDNDDIAGGKSNEKKGKKGLLKCYGDEKNITQFYEVITRMVALSNINENETSDTILHSHSNLAKGLNSAPAASKTVQHFSNHITNDAWDFYKLICQLNTNKHRYAGIFENEIRRFPGAYQVLCIMAERELVLIGGRAQGKQLAQIIDGASVETMKTTDKANFLQEQAITAYPIFKKLVTKLASTLANLPLVNCDESRGIEFGLGPIKSVPAAIKKADRKYGGEILKVLDFVRGTIIVENLPALLIAIETVTKRYGKLICRVDLGRMVTGQKGAYSGGYRDVKINFRIQNHICELAISIQANWNILRGDGHRHYSHCLQYSIDTLVTPFLVLEGLSAPSRGALIKHVEDVVLSRRKSKGLSGSELDNVDKNDEESIITFFAEGGVLLEQKLFAWCEIVFAKLIAIRESSEEFPINHPHLLEIKRLRVKALLGLGRKVEAKELVEDILAAENGGKVVDGAFWFCKILLMLL